MPALKAADILLTETGNISELLLCQAFRLPNPLDVLPDQFAHIHALNSANYILEVYQL